MTYDSANNRTSKVVTEDAGTPTVTSNIAYQFGNALNQIDSYTDSVSGKTVSFGYDGNGNRVSRTVDNEGDQTIDLYVDYHYDRENRLVKLVEKDSAPLATHYIDIFPGIDNTQSAHKTQASFTAIQDL